MCVHKLKKVYYLRSIFTLNVACYSKNTDHDQPFQKKLADKHEHDHFSLKNITLRDKIRNITRFKYV